MVNIGFIGAGTTLPQKKTLTTKIGFIGTEVIRQINQYQKKWGSFLPVVAILELKGLLSNPKGLNLDTWKQDLETKAVDAGQKNLDNFIQVMSEKGGIVVDCTASEKIASMYPHWLKMGLHIVTPNKKAFSGPIDLWKQIQDISYPLPGKSNLSLCMHESSVGAGLPIISTLNDLVRTGDKIVKIEGIFSGTLSYIFNNFSGGESKETFSDIVKKAKAQGFTVCTPSHSSLQESAPFQKLGETFSRLGEKNPCGKKSGAGG
jgi:homoserine dehydrogenase